MLKVYFPKFKTNLNCHEKLMKEFERYFHRAVIFYLIVTGL